MESQEPVILGVDVGTTSVRCIAWTKDAKRRGEGQCLTETKIDTFKGYATQDPIEVFNLTVKVRNSFPFFCNLTKLNNAAGHEFSETATSCCLFVFHFVVFLFIWRIG
jgi:glycerol kinase